MLLTPTIDFYWQKPIAGVNNGQLLIYINEKIVTF